MATQLKKTNEELEVDCEVALEVISEMFAFCAKQLAEANASDNPDRAEITTLEKELALLKHEKMSIGLDNPDVLNKALFYYAPLLKKRNFP